MRSYVRVDLISGPGNSGALAQMFTNNHQIRRIEAEEIRTVQSIEDFGHIYHNNNKEVTGIYLTNSKYISEFLEFTRSRAANNGSHERHYVALSDKSINISFNNTETPRSQARPINQNGALTNEVAK